MPLKIKQTIVKNLYETFHNKFYIGSYSEFVTYLNLSRSNENKILCNINFPRFASSELDLDFLNSTTKKYLENKAVKNVHCINNNGTKSVEFELDTKHVIKDILDSSPVEISHKESKKIIVEFSSPNLAKPFHIGHLRSTIIGNCLSNVKKMLGNDVIKMNYIGDWGTQFGLIQVGMEEKNYSEETLKSDPIKILFEAYVAGNKKAEIHPELYERAKKVFAELESGSEKVTEIWKKYKIWTEKELHNVYERLGVTFDEYCWESDYRRKDSEKILKNLQDKGILSVDEKGRKVATVGEKVMPLLKSDDTTLYLLRDLMAVADRRSKHKFDEIYYIVENGQNLHFSSLFQLCNELQIGKNLRMEHVKFGRIHGMSTRKGTVTLLRDVLDEAQERCYESQVNSRTTKTTLVSKDVADILGVSAVVVNDLKQSRKKDYEFSWEAILKLGKKSGLFLQYCHARMHSLQINSGATAASDCDPEALLEPEAVNLALEIARFEKVLYSADFKLEPCILVKYLFRLVIAINAAFKVLNIKQADRHLSSQRLLLFSKSKIVLSEGMKLLGLKPLDQM